MRVREIHFSTGLRDIEVARWCMNNLSCFGNEQFYLRWNPESGDYALPLLRAQDLRRVRRHGGFRVVKLASRRMPGPRPDPAPARRHLMAATLPEPTLRPAAHALGSTLPIFAPTNNLPQARA